MEYTAEELYEAWRKEPTKAVVTICAENNRAVLIALLLYIARNTEEESPRDVRIVSKLFASNFYEPLIQEFSNFEASYGLRFHLAIWEELESEISQKSARDLLLENTQHTKIYTITADRKETPVQNFCVSGTSCKFTLPKAFHRSISYAKNDIDSWKLNRTWKSLVDENKFVCSKNSNLVGSK